MSTVIGGAMLPHAPQFVTMPTPRTCDCACPSRANRQPAAAPIPTSSSLHRLEQFFRPRGAVHLHVGGEATGEFAGATSTGYSGANRLRSGAPALPAEFRSGLHLPRSRLRHLHSATHLGHTGPVLPIYVNAICRRSRPWSAAPFGPAVARIVTALGLNTGLSSRGILFSRRRRCNPELLGIRVLATRRRHSASLIGFESPSSTTPAI